MLTAEQQSVLRDADDLGRFSHIDTVICPGLHFCPDWDYLPVCDDSPEKAGCTCKPYDDTPPKGVWE